MISAFSHFSGRCLGFPPDRNATRVTAIASNTSAIAISMEEWPIMSGGLLAAKGLALRRKVRILHRVQRENTGYEG